MSKARSRAAYQRWQGFTEEQRAEISRKHREHAKLYWDSLTVEQRKERGRLIAEGRRRKRDAKKD